MSATVNQKDTPLQQDRTRPSAESRRLEIENARLKRSLESSERDIKVLREIELRIKERCALQDAELSRLRASGATARDPRPVDTSSEVRRLRKSESSLHQLCSTQETELQTLRQENAALKKAVQEHQASETALRDSVRELKCDLDARQLNQAEVGERLAREESALSQKQEEFRKWATQIEIHERRLQHHAATLNERKEAFLHSVEKLAAETRAARTLHPLRDYLSVTEFELKKLEIQLKTTPLVSQERPKLERALALLVEQRDFLKKVVENSQNDLDRQSARLMKLAEAERLSPLPPPPPKIPNLS